MEIPRNRRTVLAIVTTVVASLALSGGGVATAGSPRAPRPAPTPSLPLTPSAAIDAPAVDTVAPADAVVNVKTAFGARGDGRTDDTAAIQAAISAGLGFGNVNKILYFPAGTYLVSRPLEWRKADGSWSTWLTLLGENRDRTVIKLKDSAAGFADPSLPRAVVVTGSQNADGVDGTGNQAFHNFVFDLTIDVGSRNPGANGIDFLANNRGAIRNVVVRAPAGSGNTGIVMTRRWPGPCLLQDVKVTGFARGVEVGRWEYSVTAENLRLSGQRVVGVENKNNVLTIRGLVSDNAVTAVRNGSSTTRDSMLTLLDSSLIGGATGVAAIENEGTAMVRDVATAGYSTAVRDRGVNRDVPRDALWLSGSAVTRLGAAGLGVDLPVVEAPGLPSVSSEEWIGAAAFGARAGDGVDDTIGLQRALDSGSPVVYLRPGWYQVTAPVRVPRHVRAIVGFDASIDATRGAFAGESTASIFRVEGDTDHPLVIDQVVFKASREVVDVERLGSRAISLRHVHIGGRPFRGTPGNLFLTDVEGGSGWTFSAGQRVWARQLNAEQVGTKIFNEGAALWILGLKTESPGTAVASTSKARTEVLGGLLYPTAATATPTSAFVATDAYQSLTFAVSAIDATRRYSPLVVVQRQDGAGVLTVEEAPRRGSYGSSVALYSDAG